LEDAESPIPDESWLQNWLPVAESPAVVEP
jgi:hypothetical protein